MDHLYQIQGVGPVTDPMLEGWSTLAALARETSAVRLGTLVTGVTYRNPALLAKTATTLDVLSGGRAIFGLGAAWNDVEHAGYGFEFPPLRRADGPARRGAHDRAGDVHRGPPVLRGPPLPDQRGAQRAAPIQPKGPPILVGGGGEQRTLRIAAKHADMTHWFAIGLDALRHKTEVLERHCAEIGRDPATIERTIGAPVIVAADDGEARAFLERMPAERRPFIKIGTPQQMVDQIRPYLDAGFTGFTFNNALYRTPEQIARVGELLALID